VFLQDTNFNTKTDSPPANGETLPRFLQQLTVVLSLRLLKITTMASKEEINIFHGYFKVQCLV